MSQFKEVAIHGPVVLNQNVAALAVPKSLKSSKKKREAFEKFAAVNNCELRWFDEQAS